MCLPIMTMIDAPVINNCQKDLNNFMSLSLLVLLDQIYVKVK